MNQENGLTPREVNQLIGLLKQPWGREIYDALAKIICFTAIEVVILRIHEGCLQILLTERKPGEFYAGMRHSPGSILRGTDSAETDGLDSSGSCYEKAIIRVLEELGFHMEDLKEQWTEFFAQVPIAVPGFPYQTPRGPENCLLLIGELAVDPPNGTYFDIEDVLANPDKYNVIPHNLLVIRRANWMYDHALPSLRKIEGW